ncbi:MAG: hypothetical protein WEC54_08020, partial [Gemmatimonadales bacterium]
MKAVKLAVAALAIGYAVAPAAAQLPNQPVYAIPKGVGLGLNADLGFGVDPSGSSGIAVRATLGLPMIKLTLGLAPDMMDNGGENTLMVGGAFQLIPMPVSIRLQANAGRGLTSNNMNVAIGGVIGLNVPSPALSVEPWVFPSIRLSIPDVGESSSNIGVAAGVNIGLPGGIGGHAALDVTRVGDANVIGAGVGLHYM